MNRKVKEVVYPLVLSVGAVGAIGGSAIAASEIYPDAPPNTQTLDIAAMADDYLGEPLTVAGSFDGCMASHGLETAGDDFSQYLKCVNGDVAQSGKLVAVVAAFGAAATFGVGAARNGAAWVTSRRRSSARIN